MARSASATLHLAIGLLGTSRPFTAVHRALYRRLGGRGILRHGLGVDAILLTTTGRRTGEARTVPLFAFPLGSGAPGQDQASEGTGSPVDGPGAAVADQPGRWVVVASNAGRDDAPAWFRNLEAEPSVAVQLGERRWPARARIATGDERGRLWDLVVAGYPGYAVYRERTRRAIPVVVLEPR